jgi:hypothetical protein
MRSTYFPTAILVIAFISISSVAQSSIVINTPGELPAKPTLNAAEKRLMDRSILPKVRKKLAGDACTAEREIAGIMHGAFSKAGTDQTLIFYQFCQTGNGLGSVGVALFDNGKVAGNYVSAESGWAVDAKILPDINKNGMNEVALYYSGGMHQGSGGTGVDIMEISGGNLKGIGWFQTEGFNEKSNWAYKVWVKPGAVPAFFQEKWAANSAGKLRKAGNAVPLQLKKTFGTFEAIK